MIKYIEERETVIYFKPEQKREREILVLALKMGNIQHYFRYVPPNANSLHRDTYRVSYATVDAEKLKAEIDYITARAAEIQTLEDSHGNYS